MALSGREEQIAVAAIFFAIFAMLLVFFRSNLNTQTPNLTPNKTPAMDLRMTNICGQTIMGVCEIKIREERPVCGARQSLNKEYSQRLADPLRQPDCLKEQEKLSKQCAQGCRFDFASLVTVSGSVELNLFPGLGESCTAEAKRVTTMRGQCVEDLAPMPTEEIPPIEQQEFSTAE